MACNHYVIGEFDGSKKIPYCSRYLIRLPQGKGWQSHCRACQTAWDFKYPLELRYQEKNPCIHKGERVRQEEVFCCSGQKRLEDVWRCALREVECGVKTCSECGAYSPVVK